MSTNKLTPSEKFKRNLLELFQLVGDMYEEGVNNDIIEYDSDIKVALSGAKLYIRTSNIDKMIERWIEKTHEHWGKIKEKNLAYFQELGLKIFNIIQDKGLDKVKADTDEEDNKLTEQISEAQISNFKKLLEGEYEYEDETYKIFSEENEKYVWDIMEGFVRVSIRYIYDNRRIIDGQPTVPCFNELNIEELSDKWSVKLVE